MSEKYTDYSNSNLKKKKKPTSPKTVRDDDGPAVTDIPDVNTEAIVNNVLPEEKEVEDKPIIGVVSNCKILNVREEPSITAAIVSLIYAGDEVEIIKGGTQNGFYYVRCGTDKEVSFKGFCMMDYITVK